MLTLSDLKHIWGRVVFRYAGRNISAGNATRSRRFYNLIGKLYDWLYADHIYGYRQAALYMMDRYIESGDSVLDIGCGTGLLMEMAQDRARMMVGVDLSLGMLKQARNKLNHCEQAYLIASDCRMLPLRGGFDKIVSSFMFVILSQDDQKKVVNNLASLLNENGSFVFLSARDEFSPEWLTNDQWRSLCLQAGMAKVEIQDVYDYYRIVVAQKCVIPHVVEEKSGKNLVASDSDHT
ncbi:MAG: class I SAM-dependent methyltransferase [Candidatus Omnitrophica bacterium]|nr:class I SAM-dependent methyltransferase [Candidatus Omnitrophota bacterium]